jgi:hypothetical protein
MPIFRSPPKDFAENKFGIIWLSFIHYTMPWISEERYSDLNARMA